MSIRLLVAAVAVVAVPMAVSGQQPAPARKDAPEKRICRANTEVGSRLNTVRSCRTKAEREAMKQEARRTVDRIQANKVTFGK